MDIQPNRHELTECHPELTRKLVEYTKRNFLFLLGISGSQSKRPTKRFRNKFGRQILQKINCLQIVMLNLFQHLISYKFKTHRNLPPKIDRMTCFPRTLGERPKPVIR